jgi:hypothetical protein
VKIEKSYNIKYHNCSHEKPMWGKIKEYTLSYVDIASLKPIMRKLLKQNSHREKSTI